jgi:opacity protein-like surface antigen
MIYANTTETPGRRRRVLTKALRLGLCMVTVGFAAAGERVQAADVSDTFLRGAFEPPPFKPYNSWEGPYFGADIGHSAMNANFNDNIGDMVHNLLRTTALENDGHVSDWPNVTGSGNGNVWGAFVGYNWQMTDLVLGVEGAYHMGQKRIVASGADYIARNFSTSGGVNYDAAVDSTGRLELRDYATIRGRAGYVIGQFLPYASVGLTVARMAYNTSATVTGTQNSNPPVNFSFADTTHKDTAVAYGANLALGVDVTLLPNLFLRGEYEFIAFAPINGIRANISTFRAGLGLKF